MINQERLLERFLKYVQIDSPTLSERDFAEVLMAELKDLGIDVEMDDAGEKTGSNSGNVIARVKGTTGAEPILFSCHMDTVSPGIGIKPQIKDGVIYSDGTTILGGDDKAGIAAIMEALTVMKEQSIEHGDLEIVFSIYEEGGLKGSQNLDYSKIKSKYAFVFDSGGDPGQIITQGPAQVKINATFVGKPAHAGVAPEEGVSAISIAAEAISNMKLLRIDEETTANIGSINGGGPTNIVTDKVTIAAEARSLDNDKLKAQSDHMVQCIKDAQAKYGDFEAEIEVVHAYSAFKVEEDSDIVNKAKQACINAGLEPFTAKSGGGSDTNNLNGNGIMAVNFGIGEKKPHTLEEHLHIKDLNATGVLVLELIKLFA